MSISSKEDRILELLQEIRKEQMASAQTINDLTVAVGNLQTAVTSAVASIDGSDNAAIETQVGLINQATAQLQAAAPPPIPDAPAPSTSSSSGSSSTSA